MTEGPLRGPGRNHPGTREACRLIEVNYEDLEPVTDAAIALQRTSSLVHQDWASHTSMPGLIRDGNSASYTTLEKGDVAQALASADVVLTERYETDQAHPVPIEPRAVLASWEGEKVTIWSSTQSPTSLGREWPRLCGFPNATSASSCRTSAEASAASA
ncbi:molybdopterin-dependent oxidoreductase [Streptomyces sp. NBC_00144]